MISIALRYEKANEVCTNQVNNKNLESLLKGKLKIQDWRALISKYGKQI